ncbi:Distinct helicase family with a unique C-terminal domain including a metal-binding cysteine cluster [Pyrobaculum oguniense TE7]|uniref:Distinct helicase family with a unique C-terminal domain including a metal-binding cysteine cluster n=1 Tax=Pyrobaculum oguniense (strain DSM 13380 / JCM 10595 / TE7) TaxID=698757 RepID=H6Q7H4_PYROT|nr:Distinct helicase family with a unique C-terminal domain including a metal-binding cysteine cluster [Pyrobaculum oguniense TE7]
MGFLEAVAEDRGREVVYVKSDEAEAPEVCCGVSEAARPEVAEALRALGISQLYRYQYDAVKSIEAGRDTVIVAGTGMGKTEAFLIPILEASLESLGGPVALLLYPTKALARDQLHRLRRYGDRLGVRVMVYDGDTPQRERRLMYDSPPHIIVSNPDMVSQALMHVARFRQLVGRLRYVVLDDFHVYAGVFGSHMYYLLRRLRRFVRPVFVGTSATVGNPAEFAQALFESDRVNVVWGPLRRRGKVIHVLVRPRFRSKWAEAAKLASLCIEHGMKCIVFTDSHKYSEIIYRALKMMGLGDRVAVHRAGLEAEERKRVEEALKRGEIDVVIATPTLELGIDIGDVDGAILASIPPSYSRYLQRVGRVGRRGQTGYVVQILGNDPISQYYWNYPHEFFARAPEPLGFEKENEDIAALHLLAAAADKPLRTGELTPFEKALAEKLLARGSLTRVGSFLRITPQGREELSMLSLRGSPHVVKIRTADGRTIGERELPLALYELHPEAIYMHGGRTYVSKTLDLEKRVAVVEPADAEDLVTSALEDMEPQLVEVYEEGSAEGVPYQYGRLKMRITVYGYALKRFTTDETLGEYNIDPLSYEFETKGAVFYFPLLRFATNDAVDWEARAKGYHAAEHVLISAAEIAVGASKTDLGGVSYPDGVIVIYDSHVGGNGTTRLLIKNFRKVAEVALKIVKGCDCADGCPKCVYSPYCGNNNKMLSRRNAIRVLEAVLRREAAPAAREIPKTRGIA